MTCPPASLEELLNSLGLSSYLPTFHENDIDLDALRLLTEAELQGLGLSLGHRKKLYASLHGKPILPSAGAGSPSSISTSKPAPAPPVAAPTPSTGAPPAPPPPGSPKPSPASATVNIASIPARAALLSTLKAAPAPPVAAPPPSTSAPPAPPPPGSPKSSPSVSRSPATAPLRVSALAALLSTPKPAPAPLVAAPPPSTGAPPASPSAPRAPLPPGPPKPSPSSSAGPAPRPKHVRTVHSDLIAAIQAEAVNRVQEMIAALDPVLRDEVRAGCYQGNIKIMEMLLDHGGKRFLETVDPKTQRTLLHDAAQKGSTLVCKLLVELGVDPKRKDCDGRTAPEYAVEGSWPHTIKYFTSIGAMPPASKPPAPAAAIPAPSSPANARPALRADYVLKLQSVVPTEPTSVVSFLPPALTAEDYQERKYYIQIHKLPTPTSLLHPLYEQWEPWCTEASINSNLSSDKPDIGFALTEKQVALLKRDLMALGIDETDLIVKASTNYVHKILWAVRNAYLPLLYVLLTEHEFEGININEAIELDADSAARPVPFSLLAWNKEERTQTFTLPALKLFLEAGFDLGTKCCPFGEEELTLYDHALGLQGSYPEIRAFLEASGKLLPTTGNVSPSGQRLRAQSSSDQDESTSVSYSSAPSSAPRKVTCSECGGAGSVKCGGCKNGYWGPKNRNVHSGCKGTARVKCGRCNGKGEVRT